MDNESYILKTLSNAIDVITIFESSREPLTLAEICEKTKMNRTNLYRILYTLRSKGLIELNMETGKYRLGMKMVHLASLVLQRLDIKYIARPYLEMIRDEFQETVHLVILNDNKAIFIDKLEVRETIFMGSYIGWVAPLYCTASGKLLLSYQEEEFISNYLDSTPMKTYTNNTLVDRDSLHNHLTMIRQRGYSIDDEEIVEGLTCIAAPIFCKKKKIIASVSISGATNKITSKKDILTDKLLKVANQISEDLLMTPESLSRWG